MNLWSLGVGNASRVHQVWDFPSSLVTASADATYSSFLPALPQPFVLQSDLEVRILSLRIISCYLDVVRLLHCVHHDLDAVCPIHISHVAEDLGRLDCWSSLASHQHLKQLQRPGNMSNMFNYAILFITMCTAA
jgi:hypothetical protein